MNELPQIYDKVASGDFNGDGRDDLVAVLNFSELQVFLQRSDGTFAEPWVFKTQITYAWRKLLYVADFNNDGADDIVFDFVDDDFGPTMGMVMWQSGQENSLVMHALPSISPRGAGVSNAYLALDFNGDSNIDFIELHGWKGEQSNAENCVPNTSCPQITLYAGNGEGEFGQPQDLPWDDVPFTDARDFFVQDIDMDGRADVVFKSLFGYPEQSKLYYMKRKPDGGLSSPKMILDMKGVDVPVFFGDLNSDGRTDVMYADAIHFRNADGTFGALNLLALYNNMDSYWNVLGDFDGNGQVDVVNRQFKGLLSLAYSVTYLQKNGVIQAPFFKYDPTTNILLNPAKWDRQAFATGDFNSDGCKDIAVATGYEGILFLQGRNCIRPKN